MREIKFRAWDTINKGWVMPPAHQTSGETRLEEAFDKVSKHPQIYSIDSSDRYVFMQYTGLKDKNGKEVYDKDIYRNLDSGLIGKLEIMVGVGGLYVNCTEYKDGHIYNNHPFAKHDATNFEVVGNIYENKGLL